MAQYNTGQLSISAVPGSTGPSFKGVVVGTCAIQAVTDPKFPNGNNWPSPNLKVFDNAGKELKLSSGILRNVFQVAGVSQAGSTTISEAELRVRPNLIKAFMSGAELRVTLDSANQFSVQLSNV